MVVGNTPPTKPQLPHQHPAPYQRDGQDVQNRGLVQVAGKGLLARLMPEQRTAGISADGPAQKRPSQQHPFRHPPRSPRGTNLVKTEQHERPQIDQRKQAKGIGEGEEGREGHMCDASVRYRASVAVVGFRHCVAALNNAHKRSFFSLVYIPRSTHG